MTASKKAAALYKNRACKDCWNYEKKDSTCHGRLPIEGHTTWKGKWLPVEKDDWCSHFFPRKAAMNPALPREAR